MTAAQSGIDQQLDPAGNDLVAGAELRSAGHDHH
jgi:hypothetical protein